MGDLRGNGQVSNLSSALRQVNLSGQANTDPGNISCDFANGNNNNNNINNNNGNDNNEVRNNYNDSTLDKDGSRSNEMMARPIQHTHGSQLLQDEHTNDQQFNPMQYSRISKFFQNQPMEGYTLFSHRSAPNGFKVAIVLSELGLQYNTIFLDFNLGEHRAPEFVSVNPNARVPALIDHGMENLAIWESGAILLHLVNKFYRETGDTLLWSDDLADQAQINAWLFFQTSGHAPMIGQALHFRYFHTQKIESAVERYTEEVRRVYGVIEMALAERREALIMELDTDNAAAYSAGTTPLSQSRFFDYPVWLVGDKLTIADLSFVPWNNVVDRIGINIKVEFPEVYKWTKNMMRRPAVIKALRGE